MMPCGPLARKIASPSQIAPQGLVDLAQGQRRTAAYRDLSQQRIPVGKRILPTVRPARRRGWKRLRRCSPRGRASRSESTGDRAGGRGPNTRIVRPSGERAGPRNSRVGTEAVGKHDRQPREDRRDRGGAAGGATSGGSRPLRPRARLRIGKTRAQSGCRARAGSRRRPRVSVTGSADAGSSS